jgi:hypothetical protein
MSNSDHNTLSKNCSSCGLQKPLSAFLQISGPEGATYGTICSSCQKTNLTASKTPKTDSDGGTSRDSDNRIGAEEILFDAIETEKNKRQQDELNQKEEENDELIASMHIEKSAKIAKDEKEHRENYLHKRSFLDAKKNPATYNQSQVFGGTDQAALEAKIDLSAPVIDTMIAGKEKHKGALFNQFKSWLGTGTPIGANVKKTGIDANKTETLAEHVENTWGPKSKGR